MLDGLYSGAAALNTLADQHEVISNNLMHLNSSGHRRLQAGVTQKFEVDNLDANIDLGPEIESYGVDFSEGRHLQTGRPLDVAITGDGFFVFDQNGREYLSRDGRLFRNPETNFLVNGEGFPVQGEGGPIAIEPNIADTNISIAADGTVAAGGQIVGTLRTLAYENNQTLIPVGSTGYMAGPDSVVRDGPISVSQYQHELSNVQPVTELVALIVNNRQYDAVQKATRALADTLREYIRS